MAVTQSSPKTGEATADGTPTSAAISLAGAASGQCSNCGAELAPDQRYCVECGTRRGKPRFSLAATAPASAPDAATAAAPASPWTAGLGLVLTIGILLLALGVGVLIGHAGGNSRSPVNVKVLSGGSSGGSDSSSAGTSGPVTSGTGSSSSTGSGKHTTAGANSTAGQAASNSGSAVSSLSNKSGLSKNSKTRAKQVKKVLNTAVKTPSGKVIPPADEKIGEKCPSDYVGCVNGVYEGQQL